MKKYWTYKRVRKEAKKYKTRTEFKSGSRGAYNVALNLGWAEAVCLHMPKTSKPRDYWTLAKTKKEAKKYKSRTAFKKGSRGAFGAAYRNDWLDAVCSHMESVSDIASRQKTRTFWF